MIRWFARRLAGFALVMSLMGAAQAASYQLLDGQALVGDVISANPQGVVVRIGEGQFSQRVSWTNFTQEALQQLAKNAQAKPFVEPLIIPDEPPEAQKKKEPAVVVKEVERLARPEPKPGLGVLFASPISVTMFVLLYLANLYAAYEIAIFRNYPLPLVCGVAALVPLVGPIVFLSLPTHLRTEEAAEAAPGEQAAVHYHDAVPPEVAASTVAEMPPPPPAEAMSNLPATQVYPRGAFTFNRRFFETKLAAYMRVVPGEAEKDMIIHIKSSRGDHLGSRLVRVLPNELYLLETKGGVSQEVMIPFAEIKEVQVRHKDAPPQ